MESQPEPSARVGAVGALCGAAALLVFFSLQWEALGLPIALHEVNLGSWLSSGELSAGLLWLVVATPAAWLLGTGFSSLAPRVGERLFAGLRENPARGLLLLALVAALVSLLLRSFVTLGAEFTDDERVYLFQSQTLLRSGFTAPAPGPLGNFENEFVVQTASGRVAGIFPLGQPLLFAAASLLGASWAFQPLWVVGLVLVTFALARALRSSPGVALTAAALVAGSPWLLFVSGTQHNAIASAFFVTLALWQAAVFAREPALRPALIAGFSIGAAFLVRPLDGLVAGVSTAAWWLWALRTEPRRGRTIGLMALGVAVTGCVAAVQLASNAAITGSPLATPYTLWIADKWPGRALFGFGTSIWDVVQTPTSAVAKTVTALLRIAAWQAGAPVVFVLSAWGLSFARTEPALRAVLLPIGLLTGGYFLYFFPSVQNFGSLYHLPLLPLLSLAAAFSLQRLSTRVPRQRLAAMVLGTALAGVASFWVPLAERTRLIAETIVQPLEAVETVREPGQKFLVLYNTMQGPKRASFVFRPPYPSGDPEEPVIWAKDVASSRAALLARYADRLPVVLDWEGPDRPVVRPLQLPKAP